MQDQTVNGRKPLEPAPNRRRSLIGDEPKNSPLHACASGQVSQLRRCRCRADRVCVADWPQCVGQGRYKLAFAQDNLQRRPREVKSSAVLSIRGDGTRLPIRCFHLPDHRGDVNGRSGQPTGGVGLSPGPTRAGLLAGHANRRIGRNMRSRGLLAAGSGKQPRSTIVARSACRPREAYALSDLPDVVRVSNPRCRTVLTAAVK